MSWAVVIKTGDRPEDTYVYGPIEDAAQANRFAEFMTHEVDPATAVFLRSPLAEFLAWLDREEAKP